MKMKLCLLTPNFCCYVIPVVCVGGGLKYFHIIYDMVVLLKDDFNVNIGFYWL